MKHPFGALRGLVSALCIAAGVARATDYTWDGGGTTTNWNDAINWTADAGFPDGVGDVAIITGTVNPRINLNGDRTVQRLYFTNTTVSMSVDSNVINVAAGGELGCYTVGAGSPWTINSAVNLLGDAYIRFPWNAYGRRYFIVAGPITGSNTLYIGAGIYDNAWVQLNGNNTGFVGTVVITNGAIQMANINCFGPTNAAPVEIRPGPGTGALGVSLMNPPDTYKSFKAFGDFSMLWGFGAFHGPIELVNNATLTINTGGGNACRVQGPVSGTGNVTIQINGELGGTLANTYTGRTTVVGVSTYLSKSAGVDAVPGPLYIGVSGASGRVSLSNSNQINDASIVYLANHPLYYGALAMNTRSDTIGGLVTTGGVYGSAYVENGGATAASLTVSNATDCVYAGSMRDGGAGALNIVKAGAGTWWVNGLCNNTGSWNVIGGTLGGAGKVSGPMTVNDATLSPGTASGVAGTLTIANNLTLNSGSILNYELGSPGTVGGGTNDLIAVAGSLALNGTLNVANISGFGAAAVGSTWTLLTCAGTPGGTLTLGAMPAGYAFAIDTGNGFVNLRCTGLPAGAPGMPTSPSPANGAVDVAVDSLLAWDSAGQTSCDVYYWLSPSGSKPVTPNATVTTCLYDPPGDLQGNTNYSWQIVAANGSGMTTGPVWTFSTFAAPGTFTWDGGSTLDANWDSKANWNGDAGYPRSTRDTALLMGTTRTTISLNGDKTVGSLVSSPGGTAFTLNNDTLNIASGGSIVVSNAAGANLTISSAVRFLGTASVTNVPTAARTLSFAGPIVGADTLTFEGSNATGVASITVDNSSTFSGNIIINSGIVQINGDGRLGNVAQGTTMNGGTLRFSNGSFAEPITFAGNATVEHVGNNTGTTGPLTINPGVTARLYDSVANAFCDWNSAIAGDATGVLQIDGGSANNARLALGGNTNNTFAGLTRVTAIGPFTLQKGAGFTAIGGDVIFTNSTAFCRVLWGQSNQIADTATVTLSPAVAATNILQLTGQSEVIGGLRTLGASTNIYVSNSHATIPATLTISNNADNVFAGVFRDGSTAALNVVKTGSGAFYMNGVTAGSGTNTWAGTFTVNGGTLGGTGVIAAATTVNAATLAPGMSAGALTINNNLTIDTSASLNLELGMPGVIGLGTNDLIAVASNLTFAGMVNVTNLPGFETALVNSYWPLITYSGTLTTNTYQLGAVPTIIPGATYAIDTGAAGQVRLKVASIAARPVTPTYIAPTNGALNVAVQTNLNWNAAAGADGYDVYLWTAPGSAPALPSATNVGLSWDPPGDMIPVTNYAWFVVASNANGSTTGATWTFTTAPVVPSAPLSPSPANTATGVLATASFDWADSARATGYQVYLWTNGQSRPGAPAAVMTASQWTPPGSLTYSTTYAWQIVASNSYGATTGSVWTFTTRSGTPDAPSYVSPSNGSTSADPNGVLVWSNAYLATGYDVRLWLSSGSRPDAPTASVPAGTSWTISPALQYATGYSWEIVASNSYGSATGATWTFTTGTSTDYAWIGGVDNLWTTPGNWTNNSGYPQTPYDTATILANTPTVNIDLNGDKSVKSLTISPAGEAGFQFTNSTLTLGANGFIKLRLTGTTGPNNQGWNVASAVSLLGDASIQNTTGGGYGRNLQVGGQISGNGTLYLAGAPGYSVGYWGVVISGNNTNFTGAAVITNGPVAINNANAFGTNATPVELRGGNLGLAINGSKPITATANSTITAWGNSTHSGPIVLTNNPTLTLDSFNFANSRTLTLNGVISGTGNLSVVSSGAVVTFGGTAANTLAGNVTIARDTLVLNKTPGQNAIPGSVTIGDGDAAQHILLLGNNDQINDASAVLFGGPSTNSTYSCFRLNGKAETVAGLRSAAGGFGTVENGSAATASTLTLNTVSNYSFSGIVSDGGTGVLNVAISGSGTQFFNGLATNTGAWTASGGTLGGVGTIAAAVTVASGGTLNAGASAGAAGTLTVSSSLTFNSGATLGADLRAANTVGSGVNDLLDGVGNLTLGGTLNVVNHRGFGAARPGDSWRLINYSGALTNNGLALGAVPGGYTYLIDTGTPGQVSLKIATMPGAPGAPANPSPADGAMGVANSTALSWGGAAADGYAVYLWLASESKPGTPTAVLGADEFFDPPGKLIGNTQYLWQVAASNAAGTTSGPVWSFATRGTDYVWDGGDADDSNWDSPDNWAGDVDYPQQETDGATFAGDVRTNVLLNGDKTVGALTFGPTASAFTILNNTLTLGAGGTISHAAFDVPGLVQTVSSAVTLAGDATFRMQGNANNQLLRISGALSGSGTLTLAGMPLGAVQLSGANSAFTGPIVVQGGLVRMGSATCLGSASSGTTLYGGELGSVATTAEPFSIASNATMSCWGGAPILSGSIAVSNGATLTLGSGGGNPWTVSGPISGAGNVFARAGGLNNLCPILAGTNTFTGRLTVGTPADATVTRVGLKGELASADILVNTNGYLLGVAGPGLIRFTPGKLVQVRGTLDLTGLQFDLTQLNQFGPPVTIVDYAGGALANVAAPLDSVLNAASATQHWRLFDTGNSIMAASLGRAGILMVR